MQICMRSTNRYSQFLLRSRSHQKILVPVLYTPYAKLWTGPNAISDEDGSGARLNSPLLSLCTLAVGLSIWGRDGAPQVLFDELLEIARSNLERFTTVNDTTGRVLGGGVNNRYEGRLCNVTEKVLAVDDAEDSLEKRLLAHAVRRPRPAHRGASCAHIANAHSHHVHLGIFPPRGAAIGGAGEGEQSLGRSRGFRRCCSELEI